VRSGNLGTRKKKPALTATQKSTRDQNLFAPSARNPTTLRTTRLDTSKRMGGKRAIQCPVLQMKIRL
jgi:hypothetical protein